MQWLLLFYYYSVLFSFVLNVVLARFPSGAALLFLRVEAWELGRAGSWGRCGDNEGGKALGQLRADRGSAHRHRRQLREEGRDFSCASVPKSWKRTGLLSVLRSLSLPLLFGDGVEVKTERRGAGCSSS